MTSSAAPASAAEIRDYALWCAATACTDDKARVTVNLRKLELIDNDTKIRFGDDVIYETRRGVGGSDPSDCSDCERMQLRLIRMLGAVGPFEQLLIFSQRHTGNLCSIWGFTFVGIHEDNSVVIDEMSYCHHIVPTFKAVANGLLITIPALHVLRGQGVLPREVWTFSENKLKQISGPRR